MTRRLSSRASLETLKQEAKRWLKLQRAGDPKARIRLDAIYPDASTVSSVRSAHPLARGFR